MIVAAGRFLVPPDIGFRPSAAVRQIADYLDEVERDPQMPASPVSSIILRPVEDIIIAAAEYAPGRPKLILKMTAIGRTLMPPTGSSWIVAALASSSVMRTAQGPSLRR
jgi:hypothetical protein